MTDRRVARGALVGTLTALFVMTVAVQPLRAQSAGEVVVVGEDGKPITGGAGATAFSLQLPEGAACPGDSEQGDYRVQSFLVPESVDPATLTYQGMRPQTEGGWALYEVNTNTWINQPTAKATEPGGEGAIINIPPFSFAVFEPGMIPLGRSHIGIACSIFAETERHWATEIDVVADEDDPAGIAWTVVDPPTTARGDGGTGVPVALALGAAAVVATVVGLRRRNAALDRTDAAS